MSEYGGFTYPTICPYIHYADVGAAMEFLDKAFGFRERMVNKNDDGTFSHCEMELDGGVVMMGAPPGQKTPKDLGAVTVGLYVHVRDVDAVYARAKAAGAELAHEPRDEPYGVRSFEARDPEGHVWWFSTPLS